MLLFYGRRTSARGLFWVWNGKKVEARQALYNGHIRVIVDQIYYDNRRVYLHNEIEEEDDDE